MDEAQAIDKLLQDELVQILFQPIVDLSTTKIFGYEALARPRDDLFPDPMAMINAAIAAGRVGELGRLLRQLAVDNCSGVPLFLNIRPQEFDQPLLVKPNDPIYQHDHLVFLELTESTPLENFQQCASILHEARAKGIRLAIDDLGSDYSNLSYLADFNPDVVKIDRKLVAGLRKDTNRHALFKGIVQLCTVVGAKVVAEGIETTEELEAVIEAGAHFGQGYLLGRPVLPPAALPWPLRESPQEDQSPAPAKESEKLKLLVIATGRPNRTRWKLDHFHCQFATPFGLARLLEHRAFDCAVIETDTWNRQLDEALEELRVGSSSIMPLCCSIPFGEPALLGTLLKRAFDGMIDTRWSTHVVDTALLAALRRVDEGRLLAIQDDLTRLYNRRHFDHILQREQERCERYGHSYTLVMIDLDNVRATNTAHGHQAGSALICEAGRVIKNVTRNTDFAFRYGGDEFVVMLVETDIEGGELYAKRLWTELQSASITIAAQRIGVRASFGLASYPRDGAASERVLGLADKAVYRAKALGKNRIVLYQNMSRAHSEGHSGHSS